MRTQQDFFKLMAMSNNVSSQLKFNVWQRVTMSTTSKRGENFFECQGWERNLSGRDRDETLQHETQREKKREFICQVKQNK